MTPSSLIAIVLVVVATGLILLAITGVVAGRLGLGNAMEKLRSLASSRGWELMESPSGAVLYTLSGPGWTLRSRKIRSPGPLLETGLNTRFNAPGSYEGCLWVGFDGAPDPEALLGHPVDGLQPSPHSLGAGWSAVSAGLSTDRLPTEAIATLQRIQTSRKPALLVHPGGIEVVLHGTVSGADDVEAAIDAGLAVRTALSSR